LNAQALEPVRLRAVPVSTVAHLASRDPDLGMKLYEALSRELGAAHEHLFTVGQRNAAERVACFLLSLARRQGGGQRETLVLPMTRLDIADFLGLTIETVSRTLTRLKTAKIIDLEQCTLVRLVDIAKLEQLAAGEASLS
jgi:CRP/FNR family transcriptional regulator